MSALAHAIQGGGPAPKGKYKFAADILIDLNYACGASLITNECVVTSGQCVKGIRGPGYENAKVRFNQVDPPLTFSVKSITRPENFDSTGLLDNDLAVICMAQAVPSEIAPVCLSPSSEIPVGSQLTVIGHGDTSVGTPSQVLKQLDQTVISVDECIAAYIIPVIGDSNSQFCAQGPGMTGTCRGDQGSAVLRKENGRHVLIGVVSGPPARCGEDNHPSVYANVVSLSEFLRQSSSGSPVPCPLL